MSDAAGPDPRAASGGDLPAAPSPSGVREAARRRLSGAARGLIVGNTVTSFGASVTTLALPLVALSVLHVSSTVVAMLYAMSLASAAAAGLPIGLWIDRTDHKKRVVVAGHVVGALTVFCVPAAAAAGMLSTGLLFLVAAVVGTATTVVQVTTQALVPEFAEGDALLPANAGLNFGRSLGTMAGPGAGGAIAGLLGAGNALLLDGACQLVSAALLLRLLPASRSGEATKLGRSSTMRQGVSAVARDPVLVRMLLGTTVFTVGGGLIGSTYFAFGYHELQLTPAGIGIAVTTGNVGLLIGSIAARRVVRRFGIGRAGVFAITVAVASFVLIPAARYGVPQLMLSLYELIFGLNISVFRVCTTTVRQLRTSAELQGRVFSVVLSGQTFGAPVGAVLAATLTALSLSVTQAIAVGIVISAAGVTAYWLPGSGSWRTASVAR
jgi:MFS family permease